MTYSHAEATLRAVKAFDVHFMTKDLIKFGIYPDQAKRIAQGLVASGWKRH